jgi:hypothetical protein
MIPYAELTEELVVGWVKEALRRSRKGRRNRSGAASSARSATCPYQGCWCAVGWLIAAGALLLAIAIGGMMAWQWCHTSDWQDRLVVMTAFALALAWATGILMAYCLVAINPRDDD